jgi:hypothetical protein
MKQKEDLTVKSPADGVVVTWDLHNRLIERPVQRGQVLMRVADPSGPWHVEVHMADDRMGDIVRAQNVIRDKVRQRLREVLCERMRDQVCQKLRAELRAEMTAAGQEAGPSALSPEAELDRRVEEQLEARLEQEVDALVRPVRADQLGKKLKEVSGEEMEDRLRVSYILATDPATTRYGFVEDMHLAAEVRGEEGNTVLIKVAINKDELAPEHVRPGATVTAKVECGRRSLGYVWLHDLIAFVRKTWFRWF